MRWHAQVGHIVRKDLFLARWAVAVHALVVLGAAAAAMGRAGDGLLPDVLGTLSVVLLGMVVVALVVQADSPAERNAFWVGLPLHRSAVAAAKIAAVALAVGVVPVLGQLAGLSAHALTGRELAVTLAGSALVYAAWLGLAAALAALTSDVRSFALLLAGTVLAWVVGSVVVHSRLQPAAGASPPRLLLSALVVGGAVLLLFHQYHTRNVRRGAWLAAVLGSVVLIVPLAAAHVDVPAPASADPIPTALRPASLVVEDLRAPTGGQAMLDVGISGESTSHQYLLASPRVMLHMEDGSTPQVPLSYRYFRLNSPEPGTRRDFPPPSTGRVHASTGASFSLELPPLLRATLPRGGVPITLQGHLEVREARAAARIPLVNGAEAVFDGRRARVLEVERSDDGLRIKLRVSSVLRGAPTSTEQPGGPYLEGSMFALAHPDVPEVLALRQEGRSSTSLALVLPGAEALTSTIALRSEEEGGMDDDWVRAAELVIFDWVLVGSEPVRVRSAGAESR